jgi:hypothetical protein
MTVMRTLAALAAAVLASAITACGGGGSLSAGTSASALAGAKANVRIKISIPRASRSTRQHPAFISASTNGMLVSVYAQSDPQHTNLLAQSAIDLSSASPSCTSQGASSTCIVTIPAPAGEDTFVFQTYDQAPQNGGFSGAKQLGAADVDQTIEADTANTLNVTIGGIVAALELNLAPTSVTPGTAQTVSVSVVALDADGDDIISDDFVNASGNTTSIQLTDSDTSGATTLSQTTLAAPASGITLAYNGASISGPTIMATSGTITASAVLLVHGSMRFAYTGAAVSFTVPNGVQQIDVDASGAQGGTGYSYQSNYTFGTGGLGARVQATLAVTPGEVLHVVVGGDGLGGGQGGDGGAGGFNGGAVAGSTTYGANDIQGGGGGGGGASDIRVGGSTLADRVLAAGGGGGGGGGYDGTTPDDGGDAGQTGSAGANGVAALGGGGATASAGGTGGTASPGSETPGLSGTLGTGGAGGNCLTGSCSSFSIAAGGGGGGGWYGGGGGAGAQSVAAGAGGGGSSSVISSATNVTYTSGAQVGNGSITISW